MCCSRKFRALIGAFLVAALAFAPLINVAPIAFAEGDVEAETQDVGPLEANDTESEPQADEPVTYGGEQLSDWTYTDNGDNSITLTAYNATATDIIIPGDFGDGKTVKINSFDMLKDKGMTSLQVKASDTGNKVVYDGTSMTGAFVSNKTLINADLRGLDTSKVNALNSLFSSCSNLVSANLEGLNTSNVTTFGQGFYDCSNLENINLDGFNTSNVTYFRGLFFACSSLEKLDITNLDTSNASDIQGMFSDCSSLANLDLTNFDTSNVANFSKMFSGCSSLTDLDVRSFNTSNATTMESMFLGCKSLVNLDLSGFDTSNVKGMANMFSSCNSLINLDLSNFDTSSVATMSAMFSGCNSLMDLDLSSLNTEKVTDMASLFRRCSSLTKLDISSFTTANVTNMVAMFYGCSALESLDLSIFDTSIVTQMNHMFYGCSSLKELDLSNFNTSNAYNMSAMFARCTSLEKLNVSSFNTEKVTDFTYMFMRLESLYYLDISSFVVNSDENNLAHMFLYAVTEYGTQVTDERKAMAIITNDEKLKRLDASGMPDYGYGLIPYHSTISIDEEGAVIPFAKISNNSKGIETYADGNESGILKTIKADKIFYDSVAEFQEAQKAFTLTKVQVLADIAEPTKAGFTFNGWFTDAAATTPLGDTLTLAGTGDNITLYAGWTAIEPAPGPETGDVDNPGSDVSADEVDSAEQATDEASVSTATPVTGDNVAIVAGIALSMLILVLSTVVFARKRRQQ